MVKVIDRWEDETNGFRFTILDHRSEPHPSPSSILGKWVWGDGGLYEWRAKVGKVKADEISKKACEAGNEIHKLLEHGVMAKQQTVPAKWERLYDETMQWVEKQGIKSVIGAELPIYHPDYVYAGTADLVVEMADGSIEVWDWKTGDLRGWDKKTKRYFKYDPHKMVKTGEQVAAYAKAYEAMTGKKVNRIRVINPCVKTKKLEAKTKYVHIDYLFKGFLHRLEGWKHENFNMLYKGFKRKGILYKWDIELVKQDFVEHFNKGGKA